MRQPIDHLRGIQHVGARLHAAPRGRRADTGGRWRWERAAPRKVGECRPHQLHICRIDECAQHSRCGLGCAPRSSHNAGQSSTKTAAAAGKLELDAWEGAEVARGLDNDAAANAHSRDRRHDIGQSMRGASTGSAFPISIGEQRMQQKRLEVSCARQQKRESSTQRHRFYGGRATQSTMLPRNPSLPPEFVLGNPVTIR